MKSLETDVQQPPCAHTFVLNIASSFYFYRYVSRASHVFQIWHSNFFNMLKMKKKKKKNYI